MKSYRKTLKGRNSANRVSVKADDNRGIYILTSASQNSEVESAKLAAGHLYNHLIDYIISDQEDAKNIIDTSLSQTQNSLKNESFKKEEKDMDVSIDVAVVGDGNVCIGHKGDNIIYLVGDEGLKKVPNSENYIENHNLDGFKKIFMCSRNLEKYVPDSALEHILKDSNPKSIKDLLELAHADPRPSVISNYLENEGAAERWVSDRSNELVYKLADQNKKAEANIIINQLKPKIQDKSEEDVKEILGDAMKKYSIVKSAFQEHAQQELSKMDNLSYILIDLKPKQSLANKIIYGDLEKKERVELLRKSNISKIVEYVVDNEISFRSMNQDAIRNCIQREKFNYSHDDISLIVNETFNKLQNSDGNGRFIATIANSLIYNLPKSKHIELTPEFGDLKLFGIGYKLNGHILHIDGDCDAVGEEMKSGSILVNGSSNQVGNRMRGGKIQVNRDSIDIGKYMVNGHINIYGSGLGSIGLNMEGGSLLVNGNAENASIGNTMSGGRIDIRGNARGGIGYNMHGGSIYIHGINQAKIDRNCPGGYIYINKDSHGYGASDRQIVFGNNGSSLKDKIRAKFRWIK